LTRTGLRIGGLIARTGVPIPPAAGPRRAAFLEAEGISCLRTALGHYGMALRGIGVSILGSMNRLPLSAGMWPVTPFTRADEEAEFRARRWLRASRQVREAIAPPNFPVNASLGQEFDGARAAAEVALGAAISSFNYLEDHELGGYAHQVAHMVGEFVGGMFGCFVVWEDGAYWDKCRLGLMHHRWGFSIGYTSRRMCSICRQDIDSCPHLVGHIYEIVVTRTPEGLCSYCALSDCVHESGSLVKALPVPVHEEVNLREVTMLGRPRDPLARADRIEFEPGESPELGHLRPGGGPLYCRRCVGPCTGLIPFVSPGR
jgi:hypothetical protein